MTVVDEVSIAARPGAGAQQRTPLPRDGEAIRAGFPIL